MKLKVYREVTLDWKMYCIYQIQNEVETYIKGYPFYSVNEDEVYKKALTFAKHIEQEGLPDKKELIYESI